MSQKSSATIDAIVRAESWFPRSFADMHERSWGVLFHTPSIPESHDGNHALITSHGGQPEEAICEIVDFYRAGELEPRVNYLSAQGDDPILRTALEKAGFVFAYENGMRVYVHERPSDITPNPEVRVRRMQDLDKDTFDGIAQLNCPRVAKVLNRRMHRKGSHLFVGEVEGRPVSVALLEPAGALSRVDEVHTHQDFRGKGCARAVIHELVSFRGKAPGKPLYLWTDNPIAERLYVEAGFRKVDVDLTSWCSGLEA